MSNKPSKPTFKVHPRTGPYRSFQNQYADIKLKKRCVGYIQENVAGKFTVWFYVLDGSVKCGWSSKCVNKNPANMAEAKQWVGDNWGMITATLKLHQLED